MTDDLAVGRAEFSAFGTSAVVLTTDPAAIAHAASAVRSEVDAIDAACSRFRPDSELEIANRSQGHPVAVSPLFAQAIETALRAARATDGDVDPTIGDAIRILGYDRDFDEIRPSAIPVLRIARVPGWTRVQFQPRWGVLRVPAGVTLDLGATAKALASDRAAAAAAGAAGCGALVSFGGDIATAGDPPDGGWRVRVTDWHGAGLDAPGQTVQISSGGLATSSTTVRRWRCGGLEMHHIVDPRTGRPARVVWRTVSVAAASCVDANIGATAAVIRGNAGVSWLSSLGLPARLVAADGSVTTVGGWPAEAVAA